MLLVFCSEKRTRLATVQHPTLATSMLSTLQQMTSAVPNMSLLGIRILQWFK